MKIANTMAAALVASSLIAAPIAAQAAPAPRAASAVEGEALAGGFIIPLLALAAVIAGLLVLLDDNDVTLPKSP